MKKLFALALFCFCVAINAQTENAKTLQPVTLNRTEVYKIISKANGVTYPIFISLPGSYYNTNKTYPVVYMLDAYSSFGIVTQTAKLMAFNKELPELIIVGISSEGGSKEFIYNRARDFTPTYIPAEKLPDAAKSMIPTSGGAEKFLEFIKNELIPFVETNYRIEQNERTLIGHSLGGLFTSYVLFNQTDLFNRYVMISPALTWDDNLIIKQEEKFSVMNKKLPVKIYTSVGSLEHEELLGIWGKFISSLQGRKYEGLKMKTEIVEGETHYTIIPYLVTHGLKYVFSE